MVESGTASGAAQRLDVRRRLVLALLCGTEFMVAVDFSVVSVALPTIGAELGLVGASQLQWVVTAFALPFAGLLLLFGRMGDFVGRRRIFLGGLLVFTAASLAAGFATTAGALFTARAVQGLGAAMLTPTALSLITTSFREGPERERALAVNGAVLSLGFVSGVVLGGVITDGLDWRWTMWISVPAGVVILLGASRLLPAPGPRRWGSDQDRVAGPGQVPPGEHRGTAAGLDLTGALLATAALVSVVFGVANAEASGWASPGVVVPLLGGLVLLGAFPLVEGRVPSPLVPPRVLRRPSVLWGNLAGFVTFGMATGTTVALTLYLQRVLDFSALVTGFAFGVLGVAAIIAGGVAPRVISRWGSRGALVVGLFVQAAGTGLLVLLPAANGLPVVLVGMAVVGFGHVLAVVGFTVTATSGLTDREQGLATGLTQTFQQTGGAVGVPLLASVVAIGRRAGTPTSGSEEALLVGVRAAGLVGCLVLLAGGVLAAVLLPSGAAPGATRAPGAAER